MSDAILKRCVGRTVDADFIRKAAERLCPPKKPALSPGRILSLLAHKKEIRLREPK